MKNLPRIAAVLLAAALPSAAVAATDMRLMPVPHLGGANAVAYTPCDDPDYAHECIAIEFGCGNTGGFVTVYDGQAIATRLLQDDAPVMLFRVASGAAEARVSSVQGWINEMDGGWGVTVTASDMGEVWQAIADQPQSPVTVEVAGQTIDLAPRAADQPTFRKMGQACVDMLGGSPSSVLDLMP